MTDFDTELRKRNLDHYSNHKRFMREKEYESCINRRVYSENYQQGWISTLETLTDGLEGKSLLDVGCGDGGFVTALQRISIKAEGCDVSQDNIEMAKLRARKFDFEENIFKLSDTLKLPYDDNKFNVVVMFDVIEHVQNIPSIIKEVHRILKPSGFFFSSTPNALWPRETHVNLNFVHWMPQAIRRLYLVKRRGKHAADLIDSINYLSSKDLFNHISPYFQECLLNDDIFLKKIKSNDSKNTDARSILKKIMPAPGFWILSKQILKKMWPSIYVLAVK